MATRPKTAYRVMEYLGANGGIVGWVFLTPAQHRTWLRHPRSAAHLVSGHFFIDGLSHYAELGSMPCNRMLDYFHTSLRVPTHDDPITAIEPAFEATADHPAR